MISRVWLSEDRTEITLRERTPDRLEGEWHELWLPDNR